MENIGAMHTVLIMRNNFLHWLLLENTETAKNREGLPVAEWMNNGPLGTTGRRGEGRRVKGEYEHHGY